MVPRYKHTYSLIPWCIIGLALWFAYGALNIVIADMLYPQEPPLQPHHWLFSMAPSQQKPRLERALKWTPGNPWYWQMLGHISRRTQPQTTEQTAELYRRALVQTPTDSYLQLAFAMARQTRASLSMPDGEADRIASLAPSDPAMHHLIGNALIANQAAMPFFRRAMVLNAAYYRKTLQTYIKYHGEAEAIWRFSRAIPQTSQGHHQAAKLLEPISWPQARYHYLRALALDKTNPNLIRQLADALQAHDDHRGAVKMWRWLQTLIPDDATVYGKLADSYRRQSDNPQWLKILQQRVTHFPHDPAYRDQLADAYLQLGQPVAAHDLWQGLVQAQPQATVGYLGLAKLYASQQRYDEAIAMMQRVVYLVPGTVLYHRRLAELYQQAGATAKALHEYKRLVALRPDHPWALYHLGEHFRRAGAYSRAITYYQRAHALAPEQAVYLYQLGRVQALRGEHHLAIKAYRHALSLNAADYHTHYQLGLSYEITGQPTLARLAYRQVARLAPNPQAYPKTCQYTICGTPPASHDASTQSKRPTPSDS